MPQHRWEGSGEEAEQGLSQSQPREVKLNKVQALLTKTSGKSAIKLLTKKAPYSALVLRPAQLLHCLQHWITACTVFCYGPLGSHVLPGRTPRSAACSLSAAGPASPPSADCADGKGCPTARKDTHAVQYILWQKIEIEKQAKLNYYLCNWSILVTELVTIAII